MTVIGRNGEDMAKEMVLVVEDDQDARKLTMDVLIADGFEVSECCSGKEALELLTEKKVDLIISDIINRDMDGIEFCQRVHDRPALQNVPFIFLTAKDTVQDELNGFEVGSDDYINKPFAPEVLLARVNAILQRTKYLRELSEIDELTRAYNRRYFNRKLDEVLALSKRYDSGFSLAMLDIDFFKKINDQYGHPAGDYVLEHLVKVIKSIIRETDILCRYGGEEFTLIMPGITLEPAKKFLERLREAIEKSIFFYDPDKQQIKVTVSIGVTSFHDDDTADLIIRRSDKALYSAKKNGRNMILGQEG